MKKFLAALLAGILMVGCCCLAACGKSSGKVKYSETFAGTVSEQSYESEEKAAEAFLKEEINADSAPVTFESAKKEKELSQTEVEKLDIGEVNGTVESVEKWTVSYSKEDKTSNLAAFHPSTSEKPDDGQEYLTITVYIIVIRVSGNSATVEDIYEYKYYAPLPEKGETLSASYFNSVFDAKKYENCTLNGSQTIKITGTGTAASQTTNMNVKYTMSITKDAIKMEMDLPIEGKTQKAEYYMVDTPSGISAVVGYNKMYMPVTIGEIAPGVTKLEDMYCSQFNQVEFALYEKTDYGFTLSEDGYKIFIEALIGAIGNSSVSYNVTGSSDFYVASGRLYKVSTNINFNVSSPYASVKEEIKQEVTYTNFGTTKITLPAAVKDALGLN